MLTIGTAGHIDHGKTTLTRHLTGQDTDRLPEEKARGISIDLGFARLETRPGEAVGLVDVPGHERFVHNMVAGASGIHGYLLVLAADEGVMPQTREHLQILRLLAVRDGVVVLSKTDLAEPDMVELVQEEIRELLEAEGFPEAEIVPYTSQDPATVEPVRETLARLCDRLAPSRDGGVLRMPVDRVFSLKGHGTVVTGTVFSGQVQVGQEVAFLPGGATSRVRSIQTFGEDSPSATAGARAAVNVPDVSRDAVPRGSVLTTPGGLEAVSILDVRVELLRGLPEAFRKLPSGARVRVHVGTASVGGRLHLLDADRLEEGGSALAQLRLGSPMVALPGDHFLVRSQSPALTLGGGTVLEAGAPRYKRGHHVVDRLRGIEEKGLEGAIPAYLAWSPDLLETADGLASRLHENVKAVRTVLKGGGISGVVRRDGSGGPFYGSGRRVERMERLIVKAVGDFHASHPVEEGMPKVSLRTARGIALPEASLAVLLGELEARKELVADATRVRLPGHEASYDAASDPLRAKVLEYLEAEEIPFQGIRNIAEAAGLDDRAGGKLIDTMVKTGDLLRMPGTIYAPRQRVEELRAKVLELLDSKAPEVVGTGDIKRALDLPRKALIPLLEGMDEAGLTLRSGNGRIRRPGSR